MPRIAIVGASSSIGAALVSIYGASCVPVVRRSAGRENDVVVVDYEKLTAGQLAGCTHIINCVGVTAGPAALLQRVNVDLVAHLVQIAATVPGRHFTQVSSFSVFGHAERIDRTTPIAPANSYGRSKHAAERVLEAARATGLSVAIARFPAIFGAIRGDKLASLCDRWLMLGFWGRPHGDIKRSMISVSSASRAIAALAMEDRDGVFLCADPVPFSYALAADAMRLHGFPGLRLYDLPSPVVGLVGAAAPALARSLFEDALLAEDDNAAAGFGVRSDIAAHIGEIAKRRVCGNR